MRLKNKTAIVTGAASGIRKPIAKSFVEEGAQVAIFDLHEDRAQQAAVEISPEGGAFGIACDVGYADLLNADFDDAQQRFGQPADILVSNAGLIRQSPIIDMT